MGGAISLVGCFGPTVPAGVICPDGVCPTGFVCANATMTCERFDIDAPIGDGAPESDAPDDARPDAATDAAPSCFGAVFGSICLPSLPSSAFTTLIPTTINTDTSNACVPYTGTASPGLCVIPGTSVQINSILSATGSRPLVLLSTSAISVDGTIDVASHRSPEPTGAGADPVTCVGGSVVEPQEGGPGGSFSGRGGSGGIGEGPPPGPTSAVASGTPTALRGGCRGENGSFGIGGRGGGAVRLLAMTSLTIDGTINASGAGATHGSEDNGGGGGGSGGMIVLEAASITINGSVFANGGGGGAGNDLATDGSDPSSPQAPAPGGIDSEFGANGGGGSAGANRSGGDGTSGNDGGGGGGGAAGFVRIVPAYSGGGSVSPPSS